MEKNDNLSLSGQLLHDLGIYAVVYGCAIAVAKGLEYLKEKVKK